MAAGDPEEALAHAASCPFDAMITDALTPKLDARELCRRLKAIPNGANDGAPWSADVSSARSRADETSALHFRNVAQTLLSVASTDRSVRATSVAGVRRHMQPGDPAVRLRLERLRVLVEHLRPDVAQRARKIGRDRAGRQAAQ